MRAIQALQRASVLLSTLLYIAASALAQDYSYDYEYPAAPHGADVSKLQKILTSPAASLIVVLIGAAGLFCLVNATKRGEKSDQQYLKALFCFLIVIMMVWYRFSLWTQH